MNPATLQECLTRLLPHVDAARIALTGGVAIGLHLDVPPVDRARTIAAHDIDFVADGVEAVRQTVTNEFLVSHFHVPHPGYQKFLIQLVDPATRVRVDFFPDALWALHRSRVAAVAGVPLRVMRAEHILEHKLALLTKASPTNPVEEKHYADAQRLGAACGQTVPALASSHLANPRFSHSLDGVCCRCERSRGHGFPLAPKRAIFDILGYV